MGAAEATSVLVTFITILGVVGGILLVSAVALGTVLRVQATRQLVEKLAERAASTMSQQNAKFAPAPAATPLTAHTTGTGMDWMRSASGR